MRLDYTCCLQGPPVPGECLATTAAAAVATTAQGLGACLSIKNRLHWPTLHSDRDPPPISPLSSIRRSAGRQSGRLEPPLLSSSLFFSRSSCVLWMLLSINALLIMWLCVSGSLQPVISDAGQLLQPIPGNEHAMKSTVTCDALPRAPETLRAYRAGHPPRECSTVLTLLLGTGRNR